MGCGSSTDVQNTNEEKRIERAPSSKHADDISIEDSESPVPAPTKSVERVPSSKQAEDMLVEDTESKTTKPASISETSTAAEARKWKLIFIGAPGCGKGTQAEFVKKDFALTQLSTGDLLRAAVKSGSELGTRVQAVMESGGLVDDETIVELMKEAIAQPSNAGGFILDGFPRTVAQAEKLDQMLAEAGTQLDRVFEFRVDDDQLVERISGRRVHLASGRSYHIKTKPPVVDGVDDDTGEPLVQRADDNEETLKKRLASYHEYTEPVIKYYESKSLLTTFDAQRQPAEIYADLKAALST
eukprot:TRINITY_DN1570_c0_g1_i1.p1 TRINITY_DN1570_c0_g1~~TRINITY_DN1570_c0_g1_i1.p1  ORF type:complete len:325 (+),score=68.89 TRINITY_DN1570_c0_g1_i1:80-976(+)